MKSRQFILAHRQAKASAIKFIMEQPEDGTVEVNVCDAKQSKTKQQLGAIFGVWIKYLSEQTGYTVNELHRELKANFLARIYCEGPQGPMQEMWVDHLYMLQEKQDWEAVKIHADRISLSWASIKQTTEYMRRIEEYYQGIGYPLPVLDPEWRRFRGRV